MEEELKLAQTVISSEANSEQLSWDLFKKKNWKPLYISTCLLCISEMCVFSVVCCGVPTSDWSTFGVILRPRNPPKSQYFIRLFGSFKWACCLDFGVLCFVAAAVGLGVWKLLVTIFAASKVESLGRRPLLLYGVAGLTFALLILSGSYAMDTVAGSWAGVFALLLYVGCYQVRVKS